jgi:murein DD-endopeptidase / murein LD-carboxypeptidase
MNAIAERALRAVGTPFRLYGREVGVALDCVGLAGYATNLAGLPRDYAMRGEYLNLIRAYMAHTNFDTVPHMHHVDGDIAIVQCGHGQQHLMVRAKDGWVHAHAGLRRVVHVPGRSPWPIIAMWRKAGE